MCRNGVKLLRKGDFNSCFFDASTNAVAISFANKMVPKHGQMLVFILLFYVDVMLLHTAGNM